LRYFSIKEASQGLITLFFAPFVQRQTQRACGDHCHCSQLVTSLGIRP
jgi:hypothetical protein